jgi:hypothetical protein
VAGNSNEVGRSVTSKVVAILETFFHGSIHSLTEIAHHTELPTYPQVRWVGPWGSNPQPVDQKDAASRRLWPLPATTPRLRPHQPHRRTWLTSFHATNHATPDGAGDMVLHAGCAAGDGRADGHHLRPDWAGLIGKPPTTMRDHRRPRLRLPNLGAVQSSV